MSKEERQWILDNVETINADTRYIDELCCALEHSTIFVTETIEKYQEEIDLYKSVIEEAKEKSIFLQERYGYILDDLTFILMKVGSGNNE